MNSSAEDYSDQNRFIQNQLAEWFQERFCVLLADAAAVSAYSSVLPPSDPCRRAESRVKGGGGPVLPAQEVMPCQSISISDKVLRPSLSLM